MLGGVPYLMIPVDTSDPAAVLAQLDGIRFKALLCALGLHGWYHLTLTDLVPQQRIRFCRRCSSVRLGVDERKPGCYTNLP